MKVLQSYLSPELQVVLCDPYPFALSFTGQSPEVGEGGSGNLDNIPDEDENQW